MKPTIETNFDIPEQVVLDFIQSARHFSKYCPIGPKGDTSECRKQASTLIHYFTYFKFHPYSDHRWGLGLIKHIREIDRVISSNQKESKHHSSLRIYFTAEKSKMENQQGRYPQWRRKKS